MAPPPESYRNFIPVVSTRTVLRLASASAAGGAYGRQKPHLRPRSADSNRASASGIWSVRWAPAMVSPIGGDRRLELKRHSSANERDFLHW
jgi:hypothetical protein